MNNENFSCFLIRIKHLALLIFLLNGLFAIGQVSSTLYPKCSGELEKHLGYSLCYDEAHEQASWVIYEPGKSGSAERKDNFTEDRSISSGSATLRDYKGSGYDRGHLFPAGDATWSQSVMDGTFYLSNMSPQDPGFNRGIWKNLESLIRTWSYQVNSETDVVITGGVLTTSCGSIGRNKVTVPCSYYKIYVDPEADIAVGFLLENRKYESGYDLASYQVSIDSIEKLTGLDFFADVPEALENDIEDDVELQYLSFSGEISHSKPSESNKGSTAVQCGGIAKSTGVRCRNKTRNINGYCHYHQSQIGQKKSAGPSKSYVSPGQCKATTQKGTRCQRKVSSGSSYCWQHG